MRRVPAGDRSRQVQAVRVRQARAGEGRRHRPVPDLLRRGPRHGQVPPARIQGAPRGCRGERGEARGDAVPRPDQGDHGGGQREG